MLLHTIIRTIVGNDSNVTGRRSEALAKSANERSVGKAASQREGGPNELS